MRVEFVGSGAWGGSSCRLGETVVCRTEMAEARRALIETVELMKDTRHLGVSLETFRTALLGGIYV